MGLFNRNNDNGVFVINEEVDQRYANVNQKSNFETQEFDLNIEKILENWEVFHAIREIISNALDEQILTNSKDIEIKKVDKLQYQIELVLNYNF